MPPAASALPLSSAFFRGSERGRNIGLYRQLEARRSVRFAQSHSVLRDGDVHDDLFQIIFSRQPFYIATFRPDFRLLYWRFTFS